MTIDQLFDRLHHFYRNRVHVSVTYAADSHYPQQVDVDPHRSMKDDEYSFGVSDFQLP